MSLALLALFFSGLLIFSSSGVSGTITVPGDINCNGSIDSRDFTMFVDAMVKAPPWKPYYNPMMDMDEDNDCDGYDLAYLFMEMTSTVK